MPSYPFEDMSWQEFERLCYKYVKAKYKTNISLRDKNRIQISSSIGPGNQGADAVVCFDHPLIGKKIWFEFKRYTRSLGLDVIGKYAVLLVANSIHRFVLLSATPVTEGALAEFQEFAYKTGIDAEYVCGHRLAEEFRRHLHARDCRLFACKTAHIETAPSAIVRILDGCLDFSERESGSTDTVAIRRDDVFQLQIRVQNPCTTAVHLTQSGAEEFRSALQKYAKHLNVHLVTPMGNDICLQQHRCFLLKYSCCFFRPVRNMKLPCLTMKLTRENTHIAIPVTFPQINFMRPRQTTLVGHQNTKFATSLLVRLQAVLRGEPFVATIRGLSGTGKTRLQNELLHHAKMLGIPVYQQDGECEASPEFVKRLLSSCTDLQFSKYNAQYTLKFLLDLCASSGIPQEYAKHIHDFLLSSTNVAGSLYYLKEFLTFCLLRDRSMPRCVAIDNLQDCNSSVISILDYLLDCISDNDIPLGLILTINEERLSNASKEFTCFLARLELRSRQAPLLFISHTTSELSLSDARTMLRERLPGLTHNAADQVLEVSGTRPLDVEVYADRLTDTIEDFSESLTLGDAVVLAHLDGDLLTGHLDTYHDRFRLALNAADSRESVLDILVLLFLFEQGVSLGLLEQSTETTGALDALLERRLVKYSDDGCHLCFYHQAYFSAAERFLPVLTRVSHTGKKLHERIAEHNATMLPVRRESALYRVIKFSDPGSQLFLGQAWRAVDALNQAGLHSRARAICLDAVQRADCPGDDNALDKFILARTLAHLETEYFDLPRGVVLLENCRPLLDSVMGSVSEEDRLSFYVDLINGYLHSSKNAKALDAIDELEKAEFTSLVSERQFHCYNRRAVSYMHMGNGTNAAKWAGRTVAEAKRMEDPYFISKAYSDRGFSHLYAAPLSDKQLHSMISDFKQAIKLHGRTAIPIPSRDIEICNQEALVALVVGEFEAAGLACQRGMDLCLERHYMYLYPRLCLLGSTISACQRAYAQALAYLDDAALIDTTYKAGRALHIACNRGVLAMLCGRHEEGEAGIIDVFQSMSEIGTQAVTEIGYATVIRNAMFVYAQRGNNEQVIECASIDSCRLWNYGALCCNANPGRSGDLEFIVPSSQITNPDTLGLRLIFH